MLIQMLMKSREEIRAEAYAKGFADGFAKGIAETRRKSYGKTRPKARVETYGKSPANAVAKGDDKGRREFAERMYAAVERFGYYDSDGIQVLPCTPEVRRFIRGEPTWVETLRKWRILGRKGLG